MTVWVGRIGRDDLRDRHWQDEGSDDTDGSPVKLSQFVIHRVRERFNHRRRFSVRIGLDARSVRARKNIHENSFPTKHLHVYQSLCMGWLGEGGHTVDMHSVHARWLGSSVISVRVDSLLHCHLPVRLPCLSNDTVINR